MPGLGPLPQPGSLSRAAWSPWRWQRSTWQAAQLERGMQGSGEELLALPTATETCYPPHRSWPG